MPLKIEYRDVAIATLKPHPVNADTYRDGPSKEFVARLKENGLKHKIDVLPNNLIVSGRRRWLAAKALKLATVPVAIHHWLDGDEAGTLDFILDSNDHHERTTEEKAREYKVRKRSEEIKARRRQSAAGKARAKAEKMLPVNLPEASGDARDIAASQVGMSGRTAEKAAEVVDAIDKAESRGHNTKAARLREELNNGSVSAAHAEAKPKDAPKDKTGRAIPKSLVDSFEAGTSMRGLVQRLTRIETECIELFGKPGGQYLGEYAGEIKRHIEQLRLYLKWAQPHTQCPHCRTKIKPKCKTCAGTGFVTDGGYRRLTNKEKEILA